MTQLNQETLAWLEANGFTPDDWRKTDSYDNNALSAAILRESWPVVDDLLAMSAPTDGKPALDLNQTNMDGNICLWFACFKDRPQLVESLVAKGANIDHKNAVGVTALMYASSTGKTDVVATLLRLGADRTLKNQDDFTALDFAANRDVLKMLRG